MASSSSVTVHLDRSRTARPFRPDESLWGREFEKINGILGDHLKMVDGSSDLQRPPNLALAIYGGYGSGKTSLLSTMVELVNDRSEKPGSGSGPFKDTRTRLFSFPILRPNLLAEGQSFLYAFLAAVLREAEALTGRAGQAGERSKDAGLMTQTERALQGVIEYLQVLDESETASEHDPIGASVARLERHASDHHLKNALDDLIYLLADRLPSARGLILVPIDDIDLDQQKLFQTLDSLRRYLDHPRLVPICSFNGRLAEELLTSHFAGELRRKGDQTGELRGSQEFASEIALQYLSRMFPVRNRIRLAATTVKVQGARYTHGPDSDGEGGSKAEEQGGGLGSASGKTIHQLLEEGSRVFFGHPEPLVEPRSKLAMRPMVLRRQIQVVDALHYAGVEKLSTPEKSWFDVYKNSIWAVLDAHRDVLRELDIHLEDVYGWPSKTLREWLLTKIADRKGEQRDLLLDRWVYRTENRAGQVLSLLAANVFRPSMGGQSDFLAEIPVGLGQRGGELEQADVDASKGLEAGDNEKRPLTSSLGYTWFLDLWLGFYLPLILLRDRARTAERSHSRQMPTVGWHMEDAPALAMREVLENRTKFAPGIMLLNTGYLKACLREEREEEAEKKKKNSKEGEKDRKPGGDSGNRDPESEGVSKSHDEAGGNTESRSESQSKSGRCQAQVDLDEMIGEKSLADGRVQVALNLWCFYGYHRGQPWLAISLWRILSLVGQILGLRKLMPAYPNREAEADKEPAGGAPDDASGFRERSDQEPDPGLVTAIRYLLRRHLANAHQPTSLETEGDRKGERSGSKGDSSGGRPSVQIQRGFQDLELEDVDDKQATIRSKDQLRTSKEGGSDPDAEKVDGPKKDESRFAPFPIYGYGRIHEAEPGDPDDPKREDEVATSVPRGYDPESGKAREALIKVLAYETARWVQTIDEKEDFSLGNAESLRFDPLNPTSASSDSEGEHLERWTACFLRRVHGDALLGRWWTDLQDIYTAPEALADKEGEEGSRKKGSLTAKFIVDQWRRKVKNYWGTNSPVWGMLRSCPLLLQQSNVLDGAESVLHRLPAVQAFPVDLPEDQPWDVAAKGNDGPDGGDGP